MDAIEPTQDDLKQKRQTTAIVNKLDASVTERMKTVIPCMLYSDVLSQRCEHITAALDLLRTQNEETDTAILQLVRAHGTSMAVEADTTLGAAVEALKRMRGDGGQTQSDLATIIAADGRAAKLQDIEREFKRHETDIRALTNSIQSALDDLVDYSAEVDAMQPTLTQGSGKLGLVAQLQGLRDEVQISAFNATIGSLRLEDRAEAMKVLATATRDASYRVAKLIDGVIVVLRENETFADRLEPDKLKEALGNANDVTRAISASAATASESARTITEAAMDCLSSIRTFVDASAAAEQKLQACKWVPKRLQVCTAALPVPQGSGVATMPEETVVVLSRIYESYTMDSERDVHERLFGRQAPTEEQSAVDDQPGSEPDTEFDDFSDFEDFEDFSS